MSTKKEENKNVEAIKKPGVIATIVTCIINAGKAGISKGEIHKVLVDNFPDRDPYSMMSTINVQVPGRISKERFELERLENGNYRKK